jgi:hypothetical protein
MKAILASVALILSASALAAESAPVPYPAGYRDWHHVKRMVINPGHALYQSFGGIHHRYQSPVVALARISGFARTPPQNFCAIDGLSGAG